MVSPKKWASALALTCMGVPALASAQEAAATTSTSVGATATADGTAATAEATAAPTAEPTPEPVAEPAPEAQPVAVATTNVNVDTDKEEEEEKETDHEGVIGRLGVGLLGATSVTLVQPFGFAEQQVALPIIGARLWLTEQLGVQVGVALNHSSGDNNQSTQGQGFDTQTLWGMGLHVGVPLVFFHDAHYKFLVQPELNGVFGTGRINDNLNSVADNGVWYGGWGIDAGARVGAEIHFGFIGIPKLSLQGSVGLHYGLRQAAVSAVENGQKVDRSITRHTLGTAHNSDPWDLFVSNIAALYYF